MQNPALEAWKNLTCHKCGKRLRRVHTGKEIKCNSCDENIVEESWDNEHGRNISYVKCPNKKCRYEIQGANYESTCPRCGTTVLKTSY